MTHLSSRPLGILVAAGLVLALTAFASPASAQVLESNLDIKADSFTGPAFPEGDPATANLTIEYECGGLNGDVTLTATADENLTGASASLTPSSFTATAPPDCQVGSVQTEKVVLSVTAGTELPMETEVPVVVQVSGKNALDAGEPYEETFAAVVGPYVEVTFTAEETEFEIAAGDRVSTRITTTSESNAVLMTMPDVEQPAGWPKPEIFSANVEPPVAEGNETGGNGTGDGTSISEFDIIVPEGTEPGTYQINVTLYAHNLGGPVTINSEETTFVYTIEVTPGQTNGSDDEESPILGPLPVVLLGAVALALLRRRD